MPAQIRGMYIMGENPAMSDPDLEHARQALGELEHLVVQDLFLTETAMFADVILPATAWAGEDRHRHQHQPAGADGPQGASSRPGRRARTGAITVDLGRRLGLDWGYAHPREVFAEMKLAMPSLDNITWERLEAENVVAYPSLSPTDPGQPVVFGDGFPRAGGRAKFTAGRR